MEMNTKDFWENIRSDISLIQSVNTVDAAKAVVFQYHTALKEDNYSKTIYGQIGKAKFICITALQAEMERLIVFDSVFNSNHPELVDEILELFQAILALEAARL